MFYQIKPAVDTKETGPVYPQIDKFINAKPEKESPVRIASHLLIGQEPPDDLDFNYFEITKKKSKLSDLMTSPISMHGFIVSKRFKNIVSSFALDNVKFYPIKLKHFDEWVQDYYYMHSFSSVKQHVDFRKSKFYISNTVGGYKIADLENIDTLEHFDVAIDEVRKHLNIIRADQIVLKPTFPKLHMFRLGVADYGILISEQLMTKLKIEKVTALEIISRPYIT